MTDGELVTFAAEFRAGVLEGRASSLACFMVCAPLSSLLELHGVRNQVVEGDLGDVNHCWIALADGRVLDPTGDQFNRPGRQSLPAVYLGPPIDIHRRRRRAGPQRASTR